MRCHLRLVQGITLNTFMVSKQLRVRAARLDLLPDQPINKQKFSLLGQLCLQLAELCLKVLNI